MINQIIVISCAIITYIIMYFCILKMNDLKAHINPKNLVVIIFVAFINYIFAKDNSVLIKLAVSFIGYIIISALAIRKDKTKILSSCLIYLILTLITEIIISIILTPILNNEIFKYAISRSLLKGILSILASLLIFILCSISLVRKFKSKIEIMHIKCNLNKLYFIIVSIVLLIMMCLYTKNIILKNNLVYSIIYLLCIIVIVSYYFYSVHKYYYLKTLNSFLEAKDQNYERLLTEYKMFKHNIKNELIAISNLGNKTTKKAVNNYLNDFNLLSEINDSSNDMPSDVKGIIYRNVISNKLDFSSDCFIKTKIMEKLSLINYCKFIQSYGIIIDNACEYLKDSSKKHLYLEFIEDEKFYTFKCINEIDSNIDVDLLNELKGSNKKGHMGVGLKYIRYKTPFLLNIQIRNNKYISVLKIKKKSITWFLFLTIKVLLDILRLQI